jgi:hypothetical protein
MKITSHLLPISTLALLVSLAAFSGCGKKPIAGPVLNPASAKTFDAVETHLDPGGDFYLYLRTEQVLADVPAAMDEWKAALVESAGKDLPLPPEQIDAYYTVGRKAFLDLGLTQLRAFGMSSIELEPGLCRTRAIAYSGDEASRGLLWRLGGMDAPHPFDALDFLPATTVYAGFADFDPAVLWEFIQQVVAAIPDPKVQAQAKGLPAMAEGLLGMPLADLFASLDKEWGFVIVADEKETMTVPLGKGATTTMPRAAAALLIRVNDDKLYDLLATRVQGTLGAMVPVKKAEANGVRTVTVQMPETGLPLAPTLARFGKFVAIATSGDIVQQLARTGATPPALMKDTPAFQRFTKLEKLEGNSFAYLTERGADILRTIQLHSLQNEPMPPALKTRVEKLYGDFSQKFLFSIGRLEKDGYTTTSYSANGSKQLVATAAVLPTAIVAAIAVPAVLNAKEKAAEAQAAARAKSEAAAKAALDANAADPSTPNGN